MYKRRFVALWLCLVGMELFCPVFCDTPAYLTAVSASPVTEISSSFQVSPDNSETSVDTADLGRGVGKSTVCNDECICHATAIPSVAVGMKSGATRSDRLASVYRDGVANSQTPPYLPPKVS